MPEKWDHPFVAYLEKLRDRRDRNDPKARAAMIAFKRGNLLPPGDALGMYEYVVPWLPKQDWSWTKTVYFLVAALFANHPAKGGEGNLGAHFAQAGKGKANPQATKRRLNLLLGATEDTLPELLRQNLGLLKSRGVAIDWQQLMRDLLAWTHPDRYVQKRWAESFWRKLGQKSKD